MEAARIATDDDVARQMRRRSTRRISQSDALFIDGVLVTVPHYEGVTTDRIWLHDDDRLVQRALYDRLVR